MHTKKSWTAPQLNVYGDVETITQVNHPHHAAVTTSSDRKSIGVGDGVILVIPGVNIPLKNLS